MYSCKWICIIFSFSIMSLVYAVDVQFSTPGELKLQGEIIEAACIIDYQDREQWIDFGQLTARDILRQSGDNLTRPFHIRLTGCSMASQVHPGLFYHNANITFIDDSAGSNDRLVNIRGDAKGFAIRLRDINGTVLSSGKPTPDYELVNGENVLNFTATIIPVSNNIQAGDFYATVHFFMDYL